MFAFLLDYLLNLSPLIPLSLERRGGRVFREGAKPPLFSTPLSYERLKRISY